MNVLILAINDLKLSLRNRVTFALVLVMPVMMIALMGYALKPAFEAGKTAQRFSVLYLNEDQGTAGRAFDQFLRNQQVLDLIEVDPQGLQQELAAAKYPVALRVPGDFGVKIAAGQKADIEVIDTGKDPVKVDIAKSIVAIFAGNYNRELGLARSVQTLGPGALAIYSRPPSRDPNQDFVTLQETGITGKLSSYQFFAASMLVFFLLTTGMGLGVSLINERVDKIYKRVLSFPVTDSQYLLGKVISNGAIALLQSTCLVLFSHYIFGVNWGTNYSGLIITILCVVLVSSALGIVFSNLVSSTKALTAVLTVFFWFMTFISGGFTATPVLGSAADFTLNKWAFDALANVMLGKGLGDIIALLIPVFTAAAILWTIGLITYKRRTSYE